MNDEELTHNLCYLAGLIDGEGCITFAGRKKYKGRDLVLSITMYDRQPLDLAVKVFGGRIYKIHGNGRKPILNYKINSGEAAKALELVAPYLLVKQAEAIVGIAYCQVITDCRGSKGIPRVELQLRNMFYDKMHELVVSHKVVENI